MRTSSSTAQTVQTRFLPASANTTSALPQHQPPLYTMRNNFSNQQTNSQYKHKETTRGKRKKKEGQLGFRSVLKRWILPAGSNDQEIPCQVSKLCLQENGHIISAFEFWKEFSETDVEIEIKKAFQETLPDEVGFEIVSFVQVNLSKLTLALR